MPYSGPNDSSLPANVKKLSTNKRKQWIHVWESEMASHSDESRAFAAANSVVGKKTKKELSYDNIYDVYSHQVSPSDANYSPLGMSEGKGCANCQFWMSPDSCLIVAGDISPTGLSKFWMPQVVNEPDPMPVTIVSNDDTNTDVAGYPVSLAGKDKEGSFIQAVVDKVKSLFEPVITEESEIFGSGSIMFFKSAHNGNSDSLRFMATVSNNFQDREGEVITEEAHKEYVSWATKSGNYPELWLWHASAESKWGQVDWLDVSDGFLIASGTVDRGKEFIAKNLAKEGTDVCMSHGFYRSKDRGIIDHYRTFEISPLPIWAAANEWTSFDVMEKDVMPFTEEKKAWLIKQGMTPEKVAAFEESLGGFAKELKARGIGWKDYTPVVETQTDVVKSSPQPAPGPSPAPQPTLPTPKVEAVISGESISSKEYTALDTRIAGIETSVKSLADAFERGMNELKKSKDQDTADFFKSAVDRLPQGYQASESPTNTPTTDATAAALAARDAKEKKDGWFNEVVMGGITLHERS